MNNEAITFILDYAEEHRDFCIKDLFVGKGACV